MIKALLLIVSIYLVKSQTFGFVTTYSDAQCSSSSATAIVGSPIGQCIPYNTTHFKLFSCLDGNQGYNETTCTDSSCSQNCVLTSTTAGNTTCTAGNGGFYKVFCNETNTQDKFEMFSGKSANCSTSNYQIIGFSKCYATLSSRYICKNSTTITEYHYDNSNCTGAVNATNLDVGYCVDKEDVDERITFALSLGCNNYFPDCFGKNAALDPSTICGGVGKCSSFNNCTGCGLYAGSECTIAPCFGVRGNDPNVCNGKGTCSSLNQCQCNSGWVGSNCNVPVCYGVNGNTSNVCSGNGNCGGPNNCTCNAGWVGATCSVPVCFGINGTSFSVCSGNGTCVGVNSCSCKTGWSGVACNIPSCGGINSTNSTVCSGNGACTGVNNCVCKTGYAGATCASPLCAGIVGTDPSVCSASGRCTGPDTCVCNAGRTGIFCQNTSGAIQYGVSILILLFITFLF